MGIVHANIYFRRISAASRRLRRREISGEFGETILPVPHRIFWRQAPSPFLISNSFLRRLLENAELCIPPGSPAEHRSRYLLARAVIKRHLTVHLPSMLPSVIVNSFYSLESRKFKGYLHDSPIHFVMAHDGASKKPNCTTTRSDKCSKILLRGVIWYFNTQKLNVALINQIEFRDSKVFTMIIESVTPQSKLKITMGLTFVQEIRESRKVMADIQEWLE